MRCGACAAKDARRKCHHSWCVVHGAWCVVLRRVQVRVRCGSATSNSREVNAPQVWWFAGNCGNKSTAGGVLRLFGSGLSFPPSGVGGVGGGQATALAALESAAKAALDARDFARLEEVARQLEAARRAAAAATATAATATPPAPSSAAPPRVPRVLLTPVNQGSTGGAQGTVVSATAAGLSEYHARFDLAASIAPGQYTVSVANELTSAGAWSPVEFFVSPARPRVSTIVIAAPALPQVGAGVDARSFQSDTVCARVPPHVFVVTARSRMPPLKGTHPFDSTAGLQHALDSAASAGGGTVFFPRGQYFVRGAFNVPANTYLKGEGQDLVALYWAEANHTHHPTALFTGVAGAGAGAGGVVRWGLADLAIYATAYYYNIIVDGPLRCNNKVGSLAVNRFAGHPLHRTTAWPL